MLDREHISHRQRSGSSRHRQGRFSHHTRRSRSPRHGHSPSRSSRRSESPLCEHGHRHRHHSHKPSAPVAVTLPYSARPLSQRDFAAFKPMFALYLDIQKQKDLWFMDDVEARGRWKGFIKRWNRGDLAEGWYEPGTFERARKAAEEEGYGGDDGKGKGAPAAAKGKAKDGEDEFGRVERRGRWEPGWKSETRGDDKQVASPQRGQGGQDSDSDDYGPPLPRHESRVSRLKKAGPTIPKMEDLELKKENESEEAYARRKVANEDLKWERKAEREIQAEHLYELVPRAAAGTRERQIEKKREVNEKMKTFRDKEDGQVEVPDEELMGEGDGLRELKHKMSEYERKKTERELRREEINRARIAEREERLSEYREKEDKTMEMLKNLARQNFGPKAR